MIPSPWAMHMEPPSFRPFHPMFSSPSKRSSASWELGQTCIRLGGKSGWILGEGPVTLPGLSFYEGGSTVYKPSYDDLLQAGPASTEDSPAQWRPTEATEPRLTSPIVLCHSFMQMCALGPTRIACSFPRHWLIAWTSVKMYEL